MPLVFFVLYIIELAVEILNQTVEQKLLCFLLLLLNSRYDQASGCIAPGGEDDVFLAFDRTR